MRVDLISVEKNKNVIKICLSSDEDGLDEYVLSLQDAKTLMESLQRELGKIDHRS
jgi:hypothetical protein